MSKLKVKDIIQGIQEDLLESLDLLEENLIKKLTWLVQEEIQVYRDNLESLVEDIWANNGNLMIETKDVEDASEDVDDDAEDEDQSEDDNNDDESEDEDQSEDYDNDESEGS